MRSRKHSSSSYTLAINREAKMLPPLETRREKLKCCLKTQENADKTLENARSPARPQNSKSKQNSHKPQNPRK